MAIDNTFSGTPRVLCLELEDGKVVDRKDYQYNNDIELHYVDERTAFRMAQGNIPDSDLFILYYHPAHDAPSIADENLPMYVRKYATELKDFYGWEALVDGPLRLAAYCRSEGYYPGQANMAALMKTSGYEDFCRKYPPEHNVVQGHISFPRHGEREVRHEAGKETADNSDCKGHSGGVAIDRQPRRSVQHKPIIRNPVVKNGKGVRKLNH